MKYTIQIEIDIEGEYEDVKNLSDVLRIHVTEDTVKFIEFYKTNIDACITMQKITSEVLMKSKLPKEN